MSCRKPMNSSACATPLTPSRGRIGRAAPVHIAMTDQGTELRKQAEEKASHLPEYAESLSAEKTRQTLQELRVHQIELEMQNDELRRTQAELDVVKTRYFDLYDLAPVGYCTLSKEGLILESNLTATTLLGTDRGALAKGTLSRFILKEDQAIYFLHRKQLLETGEPQTCDVRMVKKDGTSFWARLDVATAEGADGEPLCRILLSNINSQKEAEAERENDQIRLETIFNTVPDGIVTVDRDMRVLQHNEAFKVHSGMTAPIVSLLDLPAACSQACHGAIRETLASGRVVREYRVACERVDRPDQVSVINSSPLMDRFGSFVGALVVIRDITAIVQLEHRLGERTHQRKIVGAAPGMKELFQ
ncbi:MAG: PAS domain-containing protein, partial [Deltaproteobacteria bacterium]